MHRRTCLLEDDSNSSEGDDGGVKPLQVQLAAVKKRKLVKSEDDNIPLPDPFPLPKNYRSDVEIALKSGELTQETRSTFLSAVASAMLNYKKYPSKDDHCCVARSIIVKYPFMKSPVGATYVSINCSFLLPGLVCVCVCVCVSNR